jgi:hypothetical protein
LGRTAGAVGFQPVHKKDAGYVLMEYVGEAEEKKPEYQGPTGRKYKFDNDACQEYVHPMDMNYLRAIYPIERVPWRGVQ